MPATNRPRILVVDDEPDFRTSLTDILESRGYECITASTVQEGAELVRSSQPNLCLVDLKLPDGTGIDLLPRIREFSPGSETIILTGYASLPTAVKAMNLGAFSYLEKPYNIDRLFLTLEKALERQRLVQTVEKSHTAYSQLLNATGAAIFSLTPVTWRISNVNPAFTSLLGYPPEEAGQMTLDQLLPDSDRLPVIRVLTELSKSRPDLTRNWTFEAPLRRKDGTPSWFSINATRIARTIREPAPPPTETTHGSRPAALSRGSGPSADSCQPSVSLSPEFDLLLVCNDVSVSRKALVELEQTKSFIEGVFAALPCGVVIVNSDYQIVDANPAYCRPLGVERGDVRSRHCHEVFNHYSSPCSMFGELCPITAARTTGTIGRVYREHRLPDGRIRNLEYTANPLHDERGAISAFVVVANDLTDLREAEERLHQAKLELENLNAELRLRHEEVKENVRHLEQANVELVKLSNAKSDFVATVSHELRTPLTAIAEGIGLVEDGSLGILNADQLTFLTLASQNTKRLARLIDDLLDLAKIEAGKTELTRRRLDVARSVNDVITTYNSIAREKGLTLASELAPQLKPVLADDQSVQRILTNLVGNAIKFTPEGGRITIRLARDGELQNPYANPAPSEDQESESGIRNPDRSSLSSDVTLVVEDSGIGIPKDQQHRLFGKFEQVNQPGDVRPRGTGLGLALTRQLVEMNQGRIWVNSDEGKGSRFIFTLPVYDDLSAYAATCRRFAASVAGGSNGSAAVYVFRLENANRENANPKAERGKAEAKAQVEERTPLSTFTSTSASCCQVMPQFGELLESLFPPTCLISVIADECSAVVMAPKRPSDEKLAGILSSVKGASLFVAGQELRVKVKWAAKEYRDGRAPSSEKETRNSKFETSPDLDFYTLCDSVQPLLKEVQ